MTLHLLDTKFPLGQTVITPNAMKRLSQDDVLGALMRHAAGDWGDVCAKDRQENELAHREGYRILGAYA